MFSALEKTVRKARYNWGLMKHLKSLITLEAVSRTLMPISVNTNFGPIEKNFVLAVVVARFALCFFRAATQSLTHDEAFTYLQFASGPWENWHGPFDANNHVLYTLLERLSVVIFGTSELSIRLPSLFGGLLFSVGSANLIGSLHSKAVRWFGLLSLLLHPLLLDFSVAARGYSLALASIVWAFAFFRAKKERTAGFLLGIGVSANLTTIVPALAMMGAVLVVTRRLGVMIRCFLLATASAGLICYLPLQTASRANFYAGFQTFAESIYNLTLLSLRTNFASQGFIGTTWASAALQTIALPIISIGILFGVRHCKDLDRLVFPLTFAFSLAGLIVAHSFLGLAYPIDRTGLWLITLFLLAWSNSADCEPYAIVRKSHILLMCCLCAQFVTQVQMQYFIIWAFDARTKEYASKLEVLTTDRPPSSISVSASVSQQPALEYYRRTIPILALRPIDRNASAPLSGYSFYLLSHREAQSSLVGRLKLLARDEELGTVFAMEP